MNAQEIIAKKFLQSVEDYPYFLSYRECLVGELLFAFSAQRKVYLPQPR